MGTRLQYHSGQRRNKSFVRLRYRIPLKVARCTRETRSRVGLIWMTTDSWSLQTLILLEGLKISKISSLKRRLVNSSRSVRKTNSAQPSKPKNIKVAHELSLQLHRGRKSSQRTSICTRSVEDTI
jgi:hypothetical protein